MIVQQVLQNVESSDRKLSASWRDFNFHQENKRNLEFLVSYEQPAQLLSYQLANIKLLH